MNEKEDHHIMDFWKGVGAIYGRKLNDQALAIMIDHCSGYTASQLNWALKEFQKESSFFPTPGQLISIINPQKKITAEEIAVFVQKALRKYGRYLTFKPLSSDHYSKKEEIKYGEGLTSEEADFIWDEVIGGMGQWQDLCESQFEFVPSKIKPIAKAKLERIGSDLTPGFMLPNKERKLLQ